MKLIITILLFFISINVFGQNGYPQRQNLGSDSTLISTGVNFNGGIKGKLINSPYTDTTAANLQNPKAYPGAQIFTTGDNNFWVRNLTANRWIQISGGGGGTVTAAANGDTLVGTTVELGGRLTRTTRIDLNNNLFQIQHTSDALANTLSINLDDNDGQVVLDNSGGSLLETGFKYIGFDLGYVKNRVQNLYASTSNGAAVGHDFIDAWGHVTQIYQGTPYNAFTSGGLMLRYTGNSMKLHVDSAGGFIGFNVGAVGAMTTNEWARINGAGHLLINTQTDIGGKSLINFRSTYLRDTLFLARTTLGEGADSILVVQASTREVRAVAQSSIEGVVPPLQEVLTAGSTLTPSGSNNIIMGSNQLYFSQSGEILFSLNPIGANSWSLGNSASTSNYISADNGNYTTLSAADSLVFYSATSGRYRFHNIPYGSIDTTVNKPLAANINGVMVRMNSWAQVSGGGSAALTATYVGYGDGSNVLTGEAAFNYTAATNTLIIDNITTAGAGSTIAMSPASGSAIFSMKSSAGAFTTTFTYDASRNFISDYRDGNIIRNNTTTIGSWTSVGLIVNPSANSSADFRAAGASVSHMIFGDASANAVGFGTSAPTHAITVSGQFKVFAPQAGDVDSIATWKDGILSSTLGSALTGLPYVSLATGGTATGNMTIGMAGFNFVVATTTYTSGLLNVANGGTWSIGDFNADANRTHILGDDVAETIVYRADNGHTFTTGIVTMSAYGAGAATFASDGTISSVSDSLLKTITGGYYKGLSALRNIRPVYYQYNEQFDKYYRNGKPTDTTVYIGFIAQQFEREFGNGSVGHDIHGFLSLNDRAVTGALVNGVNEQQEQIEKLTRRIEYLEKQLNIRK